MMLFLVADILQCLIYNGLTDGICGITTPEKSTEKIRGSNIKVKICVNLRNLRDLFLVPQILGLDLKSRRFRLIVK